MVVISTRSRQKPHPGPRFQKTTFQYPKSTVACGQNVEPGTELNSCKINQAGVDGSYVFHVLKCLFTLFLYTVYALFQL